MRSPLPLSFTVHDDVPVEEGRIVDTGLGEANERAAPLHELQPPSCFARLPSNAVIGGAVGRTWGSAVSFSRSGSTQGTAVRVSVRCWSERSRSTLKPAVARRSISRPSVFKRPRCTARSGTRSSWSFGVSRLASSNTSWSMNWATMMQVPNPRRYVLCLRYLVHTMTNYSASSLLNAMGKVLCPPGVPAPPF